MKKIVYLSAVAVAAMAFTLAKVEIKIKGSDTILPLAQKQAELYMKKNPDASITVVGGGSGVGITALVDGSTDIATSSRDLKVEEKLKLKEKNIKEVIIAYDALSVVINPKNKVKSLTREQLEGIFTGAITNWKDVGGDDEKIVAYSRESSSGTYTFFKEHVMSKKNYAPTVLAMPATGAIITSVSQTKGAIGYVGLAYVNKSVKDVAISFDGKPAVMASVKTAKDRTYPITRPLYVIYAGASEAKVKPFVDYMLSNDGQKEVIALEYIPVK